MKQQMGSCIVESTGKRGTLVTLSARLENQAVDELMASLDALIAGGVDRIALNLSSVTYISSAGIGVIYSRSRKLNQSGGELILSGVSPDILHVLSELGLSDQLAFAEA
jgi:anti-anti-sigma factor